MANEGIMAAPTSMQPPKGYISSLDAYNAASSAMQETDPQAFSQYKNTVSQKLGALNLKPSEIEAFVTLLEYMLQYPDQYKEIIRAGIEAGAIKEGDFPAEFDQSFIATLLAALNEQRIQQAQNVAPETMAPGPQEPMAMKSGGLADAAKALQAKGRGKDTILAHITPQEAEMLRKAGGLGTTNPYTGLREYGFFKDVWNGVKSVGQSVVNTVKEVASSPIGRIALGIGLTMALGPAGLNLGIGAAGTGALVGGGITALSGGNANDILKGAALGFIGGALSPTVSGYMPGAAGSVLNQGFTGAALGTGLGLATGMSAKQALKAGLVGGATGAAVGYGQQQGYLPGGAAAGGPRPETPVEAVTDGSNLSLAPIESTGPVGTATENLPLSVTDKYSPYYTGEPAAPVDNFAISQQQANMVSQLPDYTPNLSAQSQYLMDRAPGDYSLNTASDYVQARGMSPGAGLGMQGPQPVSLTDFNPPPGGQGLLNAGIGRAPGMIIPQQDLNFVPVEDRSTMSTGDFGRTGPAPVEDRSTMSPGAMYERASNAVTGAYDEYLSANRTSVQQAEQNALLKADQAVADYQATSRNPTRMGAEAAYKAAYEANSPGFFTKYAPLAGAALGATYLAGGFDKPPTNDKPVYNPAYTGTNYMTDNPQLFSGSLYNYQSQGAGAYDPYRTTTYAGGQGEVAPGVVTPTGIMQAQYSPEYGRRRMQQSIQRYYSPLIGTAEPIMAAKGGSIRDFPRKTGPINGPGTGTSDDIPAMLSDGEFVFTAKAVRNAGGGSRRKGAARMYKLMKSLEKGGMVKG